MLRRCNDIAPKAFLLLVEGQNHNAADKNVVTSYKDFIIVMPRLTINFFVEFIEFRIL